jgi:hypothetical protein
MRAPGSPMPEDTNSLCAPLQRNPAQRESPIDMSLDIIDQCFDCQSWNGPNLRGSIHDLMHTQALWRPNQDRHKIRWAASLQTRSIANAIVTEPVGGGVNLVGPASDSGIKQKRRLERAWGFALQTPRTTGPALDAERSGACDACYRLRGRIAGRAGRTGVTG